jgi:hypothetical protein
MHSAALAVTPCTCNECALVWTDVWRKQVDIVIWLYFLPSRTQRALAEAEEEVARQRREMGADFQAQAQQLELKYRQQAEDAQQARSCVLCVCACVCVCVRVCMCIVCMCEYFRMRVKVNSLHGLGLWYQAPRCTNCQCRKCQSRHFQVFSSSVKHGAESSTVVDSF